MKKKRLMKRISAAELSLSGMLLLWLWTSDAEQQAHYTPDYPMEDISGYTQEVSKGERELTEEDYQLIYRQTGLAGTAVDTLYSEGRQQELLELQKTYFAPIELGCEANTIISREEYISEDVSVESIPLKGQRIPVVEKGDILINFNCHVFGWRSGHAGIVVDAKKRLTLEARMLGTDTAILSLNHWERYPSFAVLRLKDVPKEKRAEIADYAAENLTDIPYSLMAVTAFSDNAQSLSGTQCAHLVWYACKQFGYDLDSDGGRIVTPRDIYESQLLEIVQIYGMEIPEEKQPIS